MRQRRGSTNSRKVQDLMKQNFPILIKRDTKKAQFDTEELRKQFLYLEAYSRRENLKFVGVPENVPEGQQMENTKACIRVSGERTKSC